MRQPAIPGPLLPGHRHRYDEFLVPGEDFNDAIRAGKVYHELLKADRVLDAAHHAGWMRRNLSVSYDRLGKIREEQGDLAGARAFYEKSLAISERLTAELGAVEAYDVLAVSCFNVAATANTVEEQQNYMREAEAIWGRLAAQCPGVRSFAERLTIVRRYLR